MSARWHADIGGNHVRGAAFQPGSNSGNRSAGAVLSGLARFLKALVAFRHPGNFLRNRRLGGGGLSAARSLPAEEVDNFRHGFIARFNTPVFGRDGQKPLYTNRFHPGRGGVEHVGGNNLVRPQEVHLSFALAAEVVVAGFFLGLKRDVVAFRIDASAHPLGCGEAGDLVHHG